jgi:hypothetical protein
VRGSLAVAGSTETTELPRVAEVNVVGAESPSDAGAVVDVLSGAEPVVGASWALGLEAGLSEGLAPAAWLLR